MTKEEIRRSKISASLIGNARALGRVVSDEEKLKKSLALKGRIPWNKGKSSSNKAKQNLSLARKGVPAPWMRRKPTEKTVKKLKAASVAAWKDPVKRKKMLDRCRWKNVSADKGQLELLEKWNRLGFHFEPNFQLKTDTDLFYIDGYDKDHNIVLEYDSKYHFKEPQKSKDAIRQDRIMKLLNPKKFWRYDSVNRQMKNVLKG